VGQLKGILHLKADAEGTICKVKTDVCSVKETLRPLLNHAFTNRGGAGDRQLYKKTNTRRRTTQGKDSYKVSARNRWEIEIRVSL